MIAILDSGIGGFKTLEKIKNKYPNLDIYYHANTHNFPFGNKTNQEIEKILEEAYIEFKEKGITHIILACNTASIISKKTHGKEYEGIPIIDLVTHYEEAIQNIETKNLVIISSELTKKMLEKEEKFNKIEKISQNEIIKLIEENQSNQRIKEELKKIAYLKNRYILYACTHFPMIDNLFKEELKTNKFIDPSNFLITKLDIKTEKEKGNLEFSDPKISQKYAIYLKHN